ncbi:alanine--tRNA ligase, partial [Candidatus Bipolaricaulota bacterium]|nr:alanine--tRNA ligase [Candidatus Bipolaricaulota bacterium]
GNFSFGDYFKEEAIKLAWQFLTKELAIAPNRLWASVYEEDMEAYSIWHDLIGIPGDRIARLGKEHNWWGPVGDTGACGPDSEVFYDAGEDKVCGTNCRGVACDCGRFSEIWNLVFMEYEIQENGDLVSLKQKNIDTGMGLERMAAVLQGVQSDFEIDLFQPIIQAIEASVPRTLSQTDLTNRNIIADHIRGVVFLITDGVLPGNEKQGYVLRRILRSAIRASEKLQLPPGSLKGLVEPVIETLGETYPEIVSARSLAERSIAHEEEMFRKTLRNGEKRLQEILADLLSSGGKRISDKVAFELHDTYGFPLELTEEIADDAGVSVDIDGYYRIKSHYQELSRRAAVTV